VLDRRNLPKIDELASHPSLSAYPPKLRTKAARAAVYRLRNDIDAGVESRFTPEVLAAQFALAISGSSLKPAINLSGVILHTGLGRARLATGAANQMADVANAHANVELDLETGRRGDRQTHIRALLQELTGAEDALVVNNAAAGVLLTLTALCSAKEVILSRGQMVEIGGSFRMPDVVAQSGELVEVGCTNKTHLSDYENAITANTAAILRCHPSNFKIVGFSEEPSLESLAALAKKSNLLLIDDQGSGALIGLEQFGLSKQPTLPGSIAGGADIAIASGDKLLGGPQAGIIVGRKDLIAKIKKHPLARCVRIDKLTLAALEATLRLYSEGRELEIPTIRYLSRSSDGVKRMAIDIANAYKPGAVVEQGLTEIGGGSCPGEGIATWRVGLQTNDADALARKLRSANPPIVARIEDGKVWLDPRTLDDNELPDVLAVVSAL